MPSPVVLCHGAYTGAWEWDAVVTELAGRGIQAVAVDLTTREAMGTLAKDEQLVRSVLSDLDEPAVLVGHSYSGAVITAASASNDDVARLVYVAAALPQEGESVMAARGEEVSPQLPPGEDLTTMDPADAADGLFNDAGDKQKERAVASLGPFASNAFLDVPSGFGWREHQSTYVICALDNSFTVELQRRFAKSTTEQVTLEAGHSPMITQPEALSDIIARIAQG